MSRFAWFVGALAFLSVAGSLRAADKLSFPEGFIPRFNVSRISKPPVIDGRIDPEEWCEAVKVMGVAWTGSLDYRDRLACPELLSSERLVSRSATRPSRTSPPATPPTTRE